MHHFKDKVVIVTGGAQGIGEAIAKKFAEDGATVAILDVQQDKAQAVADAIKASGGNAIGVKMDITNTQDVNKAVKEVEDKFGKVDVLVNNAGWDTIMPFVQLTEDLWDKIIAINLKGPIAVTRAVLDGMISRNSGKIVNISSDAGRVGSSGESVYAACKGGIIAFTKTLARELVRNNILVNCICPGPTDTAFLAKTKENPKLFEALERAIPMRRAAQPEELAPAVVFLASDDANYITGQTLSVSGGLTMM